MNRPALGQSRFPLLVLIVGDFVTLLVVALIGFASHQGIAAAGTRLFTTIIPLLAAWALAGAPLGVYDPAQARRMGQLWRLAWAMLLAGPMMGWLRGLMLGNAAIQPVFVAVMIAVGMLGMLIWRFLFIVVGKRFHS